MSKKFLFLNSIATGVNAHRFNVAVKNAVGEAPLELYFLDLIYDTATYDWYYGYQETNLVEEVINKVKAAAPSKIKVTIDSEGGDAGIGIAVYNFLKNFDAEIEVNIIGMAGSIASVIACAASKGKLFIARNAFEVIHKAWGGGWGNSSDLRAAADVIDKYTAQIVDIYCQRTGKTSDEIAALIENGDYWMSGTEAIELGFADDFLPENGQFQIAARVKGIDSHYRNVPKNLLESPELTETPSEEETDEDAIDNVNGIKALMKKISDLVSAAINGIKGKKIEGTGDISAQVADSLQQPLTTMLDAVEKEVDDRISAQAETITKEVKDSLEKVYGDRLDKLETAYAAVLKENEDLKREAAEQTGKETGAASNEVKKGGFASAAIIKGK